MATTECRVASQRNNGALMKLDISSSEIPSEQGGPSASALRRLRACCKQRWRKRKRHQASRVQVLAPLDSQAKLRYKPGTNNAGISSL
jgi:hypothetical protein